MISPSQKKPEFKLSSPLMLLTALFPLLAVWFTRLNFYPAFANTDEQITLMLIRRWQEGESFLAHAHFGQGVFSRLLMLMATALPLPPLQTLYLPISLAIFSEILLLAWLANRLFGPRAARGAAAILAVSAFTFLRTRSLLSFSMLPVELLLMTFLATHGKKKGAFIWGIAVGLLPLSYEAWLGVFPILYLLRNHLRPEKSKYLGLAAIGTFLGLAMVLGLSFEHLQGWWLVRSVLTFSSNSTDWFQTLYESVLVFFTGGYSVPFLAVHNYPTFSYLGSLLALAGLGTMLKKHRWLGLWLIIGFAPLVSLGSQLEPQRAIAALPALGLLAGLGWSNMVARLQRHPALPWLAALVIFSAFLLEGRGYLNAMETRYQDNYGKSHTSLQAAAWLKKELRKAPARVLTDLDNESEASFRFIADLPLRDPKQPVNTYALIPWENAPVNLDQSWGVWHRFQSNTKSPPVFILKAAPSMAHRLEAINQELHQLWVQIDPLPRHKRQQMLWQYLDLHPGADPWIRTAVMEAAAGEAYLLRNLSRPQLDKIIAEPLVTGTLYQWLAVQLKTDNPKIAFELIHRVRKKDPRRLSAWDLEIQLLIKFKRIDEAVHLRQTLSAAMQQQGDAEFW